MSFKLIETRELVDISSVGKLYEHEASGAQVLRIENNDPNRAFTISFKTPPYNDNGIAHILEHSVLNGSKKYPSKEPFVELIKGSLNTFVNAMTFADKTIYPVASTNQQDFNNLMSVYLDAVFQPKLYTDHQILQQEGWHYHLENIDDDLIYKGVVYNEMKGAMASPETQLYFEIMKALYPDTIYANESGGLPSAILSLTQEEFVEFHQRYYHPSQSQTILYGDLDEEAAFSLLEEYFSQVEQPAEEINLAIDVPYVDVHTVEKSYSITEGDDATDKDFLALNWHANVAEDILEGFALSTVMEVLFGNNQAPVKKALLEAGIAGDISAYHDYIGYFGILNITAKYTSADKLSDFQKIVDDTLQQIITEGIDKELVEAALNQIAFRHKEMVISESSPRGVIYAMNALQTWLYNLSPFDPFDFSNYLAELRTRFAKGYFEELLKLYFVENEHRVSVILKAEPGLNDRQEQELHDSLQAYKASLSSEQLQAIVDTTQALIERQNQPDTPEELAKIPALTKEDLTTDTEDYPLTVAPLFDNTTLYHAEQFTAGIDYLDLLFNIADFTTEEMTWLNLLAQLLGKLRTIRYSSKQILTLMDLYTGGIGGAVQLFEEKAGTRAYFVIRGKALEEMSEQFLDLMYEIALNTQFDEIEEMIKVVQRAISNFEQTINYSAHVLAGQRAASQLNAHAKLLERLGGIDQYYFLKDILTRLKSAQADEVASQLKALYEKIGNRARLNAFYIGSVNRKELLGQQIKNIFADVVTLPIGPRAQHEKGEYQKEAFITIQDVNYVGLASKLDQFKLTGALSVMSKALRFDYLWNNIRVKGGAYGASYNLKRNGSMTLASYRDPNIVQTLETYQGLTDYVREVQISDEALLKYIIGTMSELNQPMSAVDKGHAAFLLYHLGISTEDRKQLKEEVLNTTLEQLNATSEIYDELFDKYSIAVIGNKAQIEAVADRFDVIYELY